MMGLRRISSVIPMKTPPIHPRSKTDSMSSVLTRNSIAPKPAKTVVVNVLRSCSSIPNMSFLITA